MVATAEQMRALQPEGMEASRLKRMTPPARWLYDRGVNPIELARVLGVSASQISHWCRGFRKPPVEFFAAVEFKVGFPAVREFEALIVAVHREALIAAVDRKT